MIILTNKNNLPEEFKILFDEFQYSKGHSDYSVTELISPPQMASIIRKNNIEVDISNPNQIKALMGTLLHYCLEIIGKRKNSKNIFYEKRLYSNYKIHGKDICISGQVDKYDNGIVTDFKFTTVNNWIYGNLFKFEEQLNICAELLRQNNYKVKELNNVFIFRDFNDNQSKKRSNYPDTIIKKEYYNVHPKNIINKRIKKYIKEHIEADMGATRECTPEERWMTSSVYKIKKKGKGTTVKNTYSKNIAELFIKEKNNPEDYYIETEERIPKFCINYCIASKFCNQHKKYMQNRLKL